MTGVQTCALPISQPRYGALVKHEVAQRVLAAQGSPAPRPPASVYDQATHLAEQWVKQVERAGYTVHGTLHDLVPRDPGPDDGSAPHPDEVDPADQLTPAAEVIADLLLQLHRAQTELVDQTAKRRDWKRRAKKARRALAELGG